MLTHGPYDYTASEPEVEESECADEQAWQPARASAPTATVATRTTTTACPTTRRRAKIGMWLFLFTEVLLFGALFIVYAVYLHTYTWQFSTARAELSIPIGRVQHARSCSRAR